jgi:hypothetical protein
MFELFRDGWKAKANKIGYALHAAKDAIGADHVDTARVWMTKAYKLSLDTTFPRTQLINLTLCWGLLSTDFDKHGDTEAADKCRKMNVLLQSRFDAGDYHRVG